MRILLLAANLTHVCSGMSQRNKKVPSAAQCALHRNILIQGCRVDGFPGDYDSGIDSDFMG